jgi:hypothetical protein
VHFGSRFQNPSSQPPRGPRRSTTGGTLPRTADLQDAPKSPARLAAEAAFADVAGPRTSPSQPPQVTVRRRRVAHPDVAPQANPAAAGKDERATAGQPRTDKSPRVFRVAGEPASQGRAAPSGDQAATAAAASTGQVPAQAGTGKPAATGTQAASRARPRQAAANRRPGPVLHVVHAMARPSPPVQHRWPPSAGLAQALADVGLVLDAVARAQAWVFVIEHRTREWHRLSQRLDALRRELKARLR